MDLRSASARAQAPETKRTRADDRARRAQGGRIRGHPARLDEHEGVLSAEGELDLASATTEA